MTKFRAMIASAALLLAAVFQGVSAGWAFAADTVELKDGRVIEGTIIREEAAFVIVRLADGKEEIVLRSNISSLTKDEKAPAKPDSQKPQPAPAKGQPAPVKDTPEQAKPAKAQASGDQASAAQADKNAKPSLSGRATRVAVLNFGPPSHWQGSVGNTVGVTISGRAFSQVIPLLEKDNVDVVVIRINSGGGLSLEMERLQDVFHLNYKPKFRTVAWVESAISAAAMAPWVLEEFYMMPNGNIGAATEFSGDLVSSTGVRLEMVLARMEEASRRAKRDTKIMRAMQIEEPLSATQDPATKTWTFFQDLTGELVINRAGEVLTLTAPIANQIGFSQGTAADFDALMKVMGITEYERAGAEAEEFIDEFMRDTDKVEKRFREVATKYALSKEAAAGAQGETRGAEVGRALQFLRQMRRSVSLNPNFAFLLGGIFNAELSPGWFENEERELRRIQRNGQ